MIERTPTTPGSQATQCASGRVHDEFYLPCVGFKQVKSCQKPTPFLSFSLLVNETIKRLGAVVSRQTEKRVSQGDLGDLGEQRESIVGNNGTLLLV